MKQGLTELVFILDRSGSMGGLESDTIGGFNAFLKRQQETPGECVLTTVLFDDRYEVLHDRININAIAPLTSKDYTVRGNTALLDAIGKSINRTIQVQRMTMESQRAEKVMFVITTDGMENASREFTQAQIRQMIEYEKSHYGWEFLFLGANIDAVSVAGRFGIAGNRAVRYKSDSVGTRLNYDTVAEAAVSLRQIGVVEENWAAPIQADYDRRGKR